MFHGGSPRNSLQSVICSSPVVCLCHGLVSVVDRVPCSRWCQGVDGLNSNLVHIFINI